MADAVLPSLPPDSEYCVLARRNNSLSARQRWLFFGILAGFSLSVGVALAFAGAWPVLPYSLFEIGVVGAAFVFVERRSREWERIIVVADRVIVERGSGERRRTREFNRRWLRIDLEEGSAPWQTTRLALRYAGESLEFGGALPPLERARVARELRRLLASR